jgi:hypothetical protein
MKSILGFVVLMVPLLVGLTVVLSLGWVVLAVTACLGWLAHSLLRAMRRVVRAA